MTVIMKYVVIKNLTTKVSQDSEQYGGQLATDVSGWHNVKWQMKVALGCPQRHDVCTKYQQKNVMYVRLCRERMP